MSTIYALATPPGRAGLAVIRISGPEAVAAVEHLSGPLPSPRRAGLRRLRGDGGDVLDEAVVLSFPEGESYTGEAVVELQCHGSPAVVAAVLDALSRRPGLRPAEPGEFTRRSLSNGRMDLPQVEGLADLLDAETEAQRALAWRIFDKEVSTIVSGWQQRLSGALALLETVIDFSDQDVPSEVWDDVDSVVADVRDEIRGHLAGFRSAERLRHGYEVAIIGPPNSGKSTLLNHLCGRAAALTSDLPGTTRDVIEVHLDIGGLPVSLLDTAGLRDTEDELERLGHERTRDRAAGADLRLALLNDRAEADQYPVEPGDIVVVGKSDARPREGNVSGLTGAGVSDLLIDIRERLRNEEARETVFNRHRHAAALMAACDHLEACIAIREPAEEVVADYLWRTNEELGRLLGHVGVEDILGTIFESFCIGK